MTHKNIVKQYFDSINANNFDAIRSILATSHRFFNPATEQPLGVEGHLKMMQGRAAAFDGSYELEQLLEDGNKVVFIGSWTGIHKGEFNGIAATGRKVTFPFIDILEVKDGKIADEHIEFNLSAIVTQIKAVEKI
ncbi:ester cyclase [Chitinophaga sp. HK235]|uniref:ester cyclase n=1 Tax=Chitinophaga sp. HK235 TaxID=2952571 RepID=UPI001BADDD11|nr:ester cyclase [Chitinophaga sp. HK235]